MFVTGDLVRMPSNVRLIKTEDEQKMELAVLHEFRLTKEPQLAVFIKFRNQGDCVVYTNGDNWIVNSDYLRIVEK
jgi:hypothetical protein